MTVSVQIRLDGSVGKPALAISDQFGGNIAGATQMRRRRRAHLALGWSRLLSERALSTLEEKHRSASPIINQHIHQTVFVEVAGQRSHRGCRRRIVAEGCSVQRERL